MAAATRSGAAIYGNLVLSKTGQLTLMVHVYDARRGYPRLVRVTRALEDATGGDMGELVTKVSETLREWVRWEASAG